MEELNPNMGSAKIFISPKYIWGYKNLELGDMSFGERRLDVEGGERTC